MTQLKSGAILVTGGANHTVIRDKSYLFDPIRERWYPGPQLQTPRTGHEQFLLEDGRVIVVAGYGVDETRYAELCEV